MTIESRTTDACQEDLGGDEALVRALSERGPEQNRLYLRYRRPLLQVFHHRRIARDVAEDLLQRTFLQGIQKIRTEGLVDPGNLGGYLYKTALKLIAAYWRKELARDYERDPKIVSNLADGALTLEERADREQLAKCVRELVNQLPIERDREVLRRFYLNEESRAEIRLSLKLTDMQFNQVLFRARQRFGEILRQHGISAGEDQSLEPT